MINVLRTKQHALFPLKITLALVGLTMLFFVLGTLLPDASALYEALLIISGAGFLVALVLGFVTHNKNVMVINTIVSVSFVAIVGILLNYV